MSNAISPHLQKFEKQILSLVPYASNDRLDYLVQKLLPDESSGRHLAVKNEIKKLAQQATKPIDLRQLFTNCDLVIHNKVKHYLDAPAKQLFDHKLVEYQNLYTIAVYHEVYEDAQLRAQEIKKPQTGQQHSEETADLSSQPAHDSDTEAAQPPQKKFSELKVDRAEPKPLVNKNIIANEIKQLNSSCKVFINPIMGMTSQGKKAVGITADIDKMNNRKVIIQTENEIKDIKANKLYLWLYDHHKDLDFTEELEVGFVVLDSQKSSTSLKYEYLLQFSSPLTDKQMRVLFSHYLRQKKLAIIGPTDRFIKPLFDSVTSKGYEQLYLNKTHDIPLLCHRANQTKWRAKVTMKTSGNAQLWDFFSNDQQSCLQVLLSHADIQDALDKQENIEMYAMIAKYMHDGKVGFGLIWYNQINEDPKVAQTFKQYVKTTAFRVIKISSSVVNAEEDAYVPSALPSHVHPKIAILNRAPPKAARDVINDCERLITISDITSLYETLGKPIENTLTSFDEPLPQFFQLAFDENTPETEIVTAENDESRCEDRFLLTFKMAITRTNNVATNISGCTKNISTQGLLVNLDNETKFKAGEEIEIEITIPFSEQPRTLTKQRYVVLGYDSEGGVRLLMNSVESKHLACRAIRKYIFQHIDQISACGKRGSRIYGLQKAMRNIYAHNHFSIPFYLKATKHQQYINAASFSGNSALKHLVYKNDSSEAVILNLLSNKKFRESCLSIIAVLSHQGLDARSFYILVLPKDTDDEDTYSFWYRDLSILKKSAKLKEYTDKVAKLGQPAILKVELKKSSKAQNMYYRDEISYLKSLDKDLALDIEVQLDSTIGIGEVTDLTDIAMKMIAQSK